MAIVITKIAPYSFRIEDDETEAIYRENRYTGGITGDFVTIKTMNGAPLFVNEPYSIFSYEDDTEEGNVPFIPDNADELFIKLQEVDFFWKGNEDGGSGSPIYLDDLLDVNASKLGNAGKVLGVNESATAWIPLSIGGVSRIQDATDWNGGTPQINKYVIVDNTGKFNQADIEQIINTPVANTEHRVIVKGYGKTEPFVKEIGDRCWHIDENNKIRIEEYLGGDPNLDSSYKLIGYD